MTDLGIQGVWDLISGTQFPLAMEVQLHSFARAALIYFHTPDDLNDSYAVSYGFSSWESDIMVSAGVAPFQGFGGESLVLALFWDSERPSPFIVSPYLYTRLGKYPFPIRMLTLLDWEPS